jgi:hypothetical protein
VKRHALGKWSKVLVALGIAMSCAWAVSGALSLKDRVEVTKMTKQMKTHCVGRFLIDLPENATVAMRGAFIGGFDISTNPNETDQGFTERVAKKETEINAKPNELGTKNMEVARTIQRDGMVGKIFVFNRKSIRGLDVTYTNVQMAGYVRMNGISFNVTSLWNDLGQDKDLEKLIGHLRPLAENEIPTEPGFCLKRGIVLDPLTPDDGERVTLFARLPGHPDISFDFDMTAGIVRAPNLLVRNTQVMAKESPDVRARFNNLREGQRAINGVPGVELVQKVREENFTVGYDFGWESIAKKDDVMLPQLTLGLGAGNSLRPGSGPVQSSLSETAIVALWDAISSSVRLRPTTPPKVSVEPPPIPPRGTYALANTACPQAGWWRCLDGAPNLEISGGKTQYFRTGDLIPQATVLIAPTLLQRVKGEEPSFQSEIATTWKLVDYRRHPRTAPALPLAEATAVEPGGSAKCAEVENCTAPVTTPVGKIVETDTPCPESGWWRCPESDAVDGTRWFARGVLLPRATFRSPSSWADKLKGTPGVIRYRSVWQFVRHDDGPALAPGIADDEGGSAA